MKMGKYIIDDEWSFTNQLVEDSWYKGIKKEVTYAEDEDGPIHSYQRIVIVYNRHSKQWTLYFGSDMFFNIYKKFKGIDELHHSTFMYTTIESAKLSVDNFLVRLNRLKVFL